MPTIGENIRNARKALKMSQDDLAEAIGANRVTISKYENGGYLPSVPALERLAAALNTTPAQLSGTATVNTAPWNPDDMNYAEQEDEAIRIMARGMAKMSPENRQKLLDVARTFFREDFDEQGNKQ